MSESKAPGTFDRLLGSLDGLPDVTKTKPVVIRVVPPLGVGGTQLFVIQTYRQKDQGDSVFLEFVNDGATVQIVLPPSVCNTIARQRDQLTTKSRSRAAKAVAEERKQRGELPAFMKRKVGHR